MLEKKYVLDHLNELAKHSEINQHSIYFKHIDFEPDPGFIVVEWDGKRFIVTVEED